MRRMIGKRKFSPEDPLILGSFFPPFCKHLCTAGNLRLDSAQQLHKRATNFLLTLLTFACAKAALRSEKPILHSHAQGCHAAETLSFLLLLQRRLRPRPKVTSVQVATLPIFCKAFADVWICAPFLPSILCNTKGGGDYGQVRCKILLSAVRKIRSTVLPNKKGGGETNEGSRQGRL